jgi:hypothetical protein
MKAFKKGIFTPQNQTKYVGRRPLMYKSSYEYKFMNFLDKTAAVTEWSYESIVIRYVHPLTGRPARYYPDFLFTYKDTSGNTIIEMVEIKPYKQTIPPKAGKGKKQIYLLQEAKTWVVNKAKWEAAILYCSNKGIKFRIMTEKDLNIR